MSEHPNAAIVRVGYEAMERGDAATLAALLGDNVTWHESTAGFEGDYHGRDQALGLLGKLGQEGVEMRFSVHDILANDDHAVVLHEATLTRKGRTLTGQDADVYHLRDGRITAHWHLAVDPKPDEAFFTA